VTPWAARVPHQMALKNNVNKQELMELAVMLGLF
jgi:hypothetical protein